SDSRKTSCTPAFFDSYNATAMIWYDIMYHTRARGPSMGIRTHPTNLSQSYISFLWNNPRLYLYTNERITDPLFSDTNDLRDIILSRQLPYFSYLYAVVYSTNVPDAPHYR